MMQESRLTNLQKRRITECLQSRCEAPVGGSTVRFSDRSFLRFPQKEHPYRRVGTPPCLLGPANPKVPRSSCPPGPRDAAPRPVAPAALMPEKSSALVQRVGSQKPGPVSHGFNALDWFCFFSGDLEKEKRRLQNLMSLGEEEDAPAASSRGHDPEPQQSDAFQEGTHVPAHTIPPPERRPRPVLFGSCGRD